MKEPCFITLLMILTWSSSHSYWAFKLGRNARFIEIRQQALTTLRYHELPSIHLELLTAAIEVPRMAAASISTGS